MQGWSERESLLENGDEIVIYNITENPVCAHDQRVTQFCTRLGIDHKVKQNLEFGVGGKVEADQIQGVVFGLARALPDFEFSSAHLARFRRYFHVR